MFPLSPRIDFMLAAHKASHYHCRVKTLASLEPQTAFSVRSIECPTRAPQQARKAKSVDRTLFNVERFR